MTSQSASIVQRLWAYCNVLRDDDVSYGDYVGQLTYLCFRKMDTEQVEVFGKPASFRSPATGRASAVWRARRWRTSAATCSTGWARSRAEMQRSHVLRLPTGIFYARGLNANLLFFDCRAGGAEAATDTLWIHDLRTNEHFTLRQNPLTRDDLDDFVACYQPENRHQRAATWSKDNSDGRWRAFTFDELMARDRANLDIFWIRDESLEETANLPEPDVLAAQIVEDLEAVLEQFRAIADDLGGPI